jgi:zinc transport system substrate-binding protein
MTHWLRFVLIAGLACATVATGAAATPPSVVATIKPVHALVAAVMDGVAEPRLLIRGGGSPHTYALRPSDARALEAADVVFWVGPDLETFLAKPLAALARRARVVALHEAEGVRLLPYREAGTAAIGEHDDDDHKHGDHAEHHAEHHADDPQEHDHGHDHGGTDMHVWLDPANAQAMVAAVARTLAAADPAHAAVYRDNAEAVAARIAALDTELGTTLAPLRGRPYVVFHDAYRYLEARYGLANAGAITVSPEQPPGARRLAEIRATIERTGAACVFAEPQFAPAVVGTVVESTSARTGVLDPLGADIEAGPEAYFQLMRGLASDLRTCLAATG